MQNLVFRRFDVAWLLAVLAASASASVAAAGQKPDREHPHVRSVVAVSSSASNSSLSEKSMLAITVDNSRDMATRPAAGAITAAHPMPTLNGFSLLILAASLGVAALLIWRKRQ